MATIRLRCIDPAANWPAGLTKEYSEVVGRDLLRVAPLHYIEIPPSADPDAFSPTHEQARAEAVYQAKLRVLLMDCKCKNREDRLAKIRELRALLAPSG